MRTILFLFLAVLLVTTVMVLPPLTTANKVSQDKGTDSAGMAVGYVQKFAESQPVREFAKLDSGTSAGSPEEIRELDERREQRREKQFAMALNIQRALGLNVDEKNEMNREIMRREDPNAPRTPDRALSTNQNQPKRNGPAPPPPNPPSLTFEGVSIADTIGVGQGFVPPDTNGDVGPANYVQTVNVAFRIWDKAGNPLTSVASLNTLFAPIGGACGSSEDGDPIVMYDQLADRWLISQFCTVANPNNHQLIAISKNGDPAGSYYLYDFMMPNNKFNDYPHFGVWPDAYYMTDNQFNQAGTAFLQGGVFAFNRTKMLTGDPTASFIYFDTATLFPPGTGINGTDGIGGMLPADLDGYTPPPAGAPCPFMYFQANENAGEPGDQLRIFDFHVDFTVPANSTFTERTGSPLVVAPFDPIPVPNTRNVIPQPAPATAGSFLDVISDRLMFRLSYRNLGTSETLIGTHTVNAATNPVFRAGVRFYQLNRATPAAAFTIGEQQTFAPADTEHRWMGSAANNFKGDVAVGFSTSSTTVFPSIRYAARLGTDTPGTGLVRGETSIVAGGGSQTSTSGRWGDYSDLTIDPSDDCTFWYTQEYYSVSSEPGNSSAPWHTRIAKFAPGPCSVSPRGTIAGTITSCQTGLPIPNAFVSVSNGTSRATGAAGTYSAVVIPGTYNVSATGFGYDTASTSGLVVVNGGSVTFNACLNGNLKQPVADTAAILADSCNSNGIIDPNETISISLGVKNTGTLNTANLVGTLQATGGVTSPGGPQNYGAVVAGGATVFRTFTFTSGNLACGAPLVISLQLQDGATDLGTITYNFSTGNIVANNYSSGNISVAIPDNGPAVDIPITVADVMTLNDVNVSFRLNHTFDGDVRVSLVHPDNTVIPLVTNRGSSGANFGTGPNDCSGTPTVIDDQAATAISAGAPPFAASFRPESPLSALNGKPSNGTWKLRVQDTANVDTGTVGCVKLELNKHIVCCGALINSVPPAVITAESISPANNAPDPDETVTVNLPLKNVGGNDTATLIAALQPTGGVGNPTGPQNYGVVVAGGGNVSRPFTFTAQGTCGNTITLTLALQDGATNLGTISYTMQLGTLNTVTIFSENFDGAAPPALPAGWVTAATGVEVNWVTSATNPNSAPNDAFAPDVNNIGNTTLDTPTINVPAGGAQLTFKNLFNMEASAVTPTRGFDGMVLEISINGGAFNDITTGGNAFIAGGYTRTIDATFSSPIAGRQAWSGLSGGTTAAPTYITSTINLPAAANGQPVKLRWRVGTDNSAVAAGSNGVRVDSIVVSGSNQVCNTQSCTLVCPANIVVPADGSGVSALVNFPAISVTGACGVPVYATPSGSTFPLGITTVNVSGLNGGACSFTVTVTPAGLTSSNLLISEFRERGVGGANDEFVELYNPSSSPLTISVLDGSTGWALVASDNVTRFVIPNGTVIPSHGHYLGVNSAGYSLANYGGVGSGAGDITYTTDIPDNSGLALFSTSNPANFLLGNRVDAVGFASTAALFKEGTGLPALTPFSIDFSLVRDNCGKGGSITSMAPCPSGGDSVDTNNNATDFYFVDTNGTNAGAGQRLGAPGPENLASPIQRNSTITSGLVFPCLGAGISPNRVRDFTSDPANNSTFGTLDIRRSFTNNTGAPVTRLRFRVIDISTFPAPSGIADLRPRTSTALASVVNPCGASVNLEGAVLEQPPTQANGGGFNSSLTVGTVTLAPGKSKRGRISTTQFQPDGTVQLNAPLGVGATINVRFLLGIQQTGNFKLYINVEAIP